MSSDGNEGPKASLSESAMQRLSALLEENESLKQSVTQLNSHLTQLQSSASLADTRLDALEQQTSQLCMLFAATQRLHGSRDRKDVLLGIEEILAACVGCEEFALYEVNPERQVLELAVAVGVTPDPSLPLGQGVAGKVVSSGQPFVADPSVTGPGAVTACIPLRVASETTGVLLLHRLLPQKRQLEAGDRELLELLETQAGAALYCARLKGQGTGSRPRGPA